MAMIAVKRTIRTLARGPVAGGGISPVVAADMCSCRSPRCVRSVIDGGSAEGWAGGRAKASENASAVGSEDIGGELEARSVGVGEIGRGEQGATEGCGGRDEQRGWGCARDEDDGRGGHQVAVEAEERSE